MSGSRVQLFAFMAVLLLPFAVRAWLGRADRVESELSPEVLAGEARTLHIITPHNQDIRRAFELAFSDWHRSRYGQRVAITYLTPGGGTNDMVRFLKDAYGAYRDADGKLPPEDQIHIGLDVAWGGGDYVYERDLKPILEPLSVSPKIIAEAFPERDLAGVALLDPEAGAGAPRWVGVVLSSFGLIYAPGVYASLGLPAPETWQDLARPELAGMVALADPTRSGSAAYAYMMVLQREMAASERRFFEAHPELDPDAVDVEDRAGYRAALGEGWKEGMRTLVRMAANARYFTDSASRPCSDVGDGESAAGIAIDFYARVYQEQIGEQRIRFHAPRGATAITPDPVGVLYGSSGEHEETANRFVEFLLSREGQRLWNLQPGHSPYLTRSLRRMPVRRDVYADRTGFADDENPFEFAEGFNMRQRWLRQLGRLLPVWTAAWLDTKSALDGAYRAVLSIADPARRERLLFELSDIPIEYEELMAPHAAPAVEGLDPRLEAARARLSLGERFRRHYDDVLARAEAQP